MRGVRATIVAVQRQLVLHILNPLLLPTDAHNVKKHRVIKTF